MAFCSQKGQIKRHCLVGVLQRIKKGHDETESERRPEFAFQLRRADCGSDCFEEVCVRSENVGADVPIGRGIARVDG